MSSADSEMTSSEETYSTPSPPLTPPSLEELSRRGVRSLLLPWIIRLASRSSSSSSQSPREAVVYVNLNTGSILMIEGTNDVNAILRTKDGPLPASKASILAMPSVEVQEEGVECVICLTEFGVNGEAKEMPCKHRYHSGCIEKWLGIHGSCPICRYKMPVEEETQNLKSGGHEEEADGGVEEADGGAEEADDGGVDDGDDDGGEGDGGEELRNAPAFVFHIFVTGSRAELASGQSEEETGNLNSGSDPVDDGSETQDIEIDGSTN